MGGRLRQTGLPCFLELTPVPTFIRYASFPLIEGGAVLVNETQLGAKVVEFDHGYAVLGTLGYAFKNSNWRMEGGGDLALKQTFQKVEGSSSGKALSNAALSGDAISFSVEGREYSGRVSGERIEGTVKSSGKDARWSALRSK